MTGSTEHATYNMYPAVTCDSRDETGFNEQYGHRVDRGRVAIQRETGVTAVRRTVDDQTHQQVVEAFNGGPLFSGDAYSPSY